MTHAFLATGQNELHGAIAGKTPAELSYASADATKLFMGLATGTDAPQGRVRKSDVAVAKEYLGEAQLRELDRSVSACLDLAERRGQCGLLRKVAEWATLLYSFLEHSSYPILSKEGRVSALEGSAAPRAFGASPTRAGARKLAKAPSAKRRKA